MNRESSNIKKLLASIAYDFLKWQIDNYQKMKVLNNTKRPLQYLLKELTRQIQLLNTSRFPPVYNPNNHKQY